jgi:hypothetical protein
MVLSRTVLALLGVLQLCLAGAGGGGGSVLAAVGGLLFIAGGLLSFVAAVTPLRSLIAGCGAVNLGVCVFLVLVNLPAVQQDTVVFDALRIFGSVPLCAVLLSGWLWMRCRGAQFLQ